MSRSSILDFDPPVRVVDLDDPLAGRDRCSLHDAIARAHLVVIVAGASNHAAVSVARDEARRRGVPMLLCRSSGLGNVARLLEAVARHRALGSTSALRKARPPGRARVNGPPSPTNARKSWISKFPATPSVRWCLPHHALDGGSAPGRDATRGDHEMTTIASRIEIVSRGSWVSVAHENLYLERYGYENARNREVSEEPGGGHARIFERFVPMQRVGLKVSAGTYYAGRIQVSPLPLAAPVTETRDRILGVEVSHFGVTTTASNLVSTLLEGALDLLTLGPVIGQVEIPLIEPASTLPGQFVQYSVTRLIVGQTSATSSVETEQEASAFSQTFKVVFLGYAA